jgi:uncharacterized protein
MASDGNQARQSSRSARAPAARSRVPHGPAVAHVDHRNGGQGIGREFGHGPSRLRQRRSETCNCATFAAAEGRLDGCGIVALRQARQSAAMASHPATLVGLTLIFILAGFVKGTIGMGLPTVAIAFLTLLMPPAEAATILILPSFVTNVWQLAVGPQLRGLARPLWPLLGAAALATIAAGRWLGAVSNPATLTALGAAIVLYAIIGLAPLRLEVPARTEFWLGPLIGAMTGVMTALTGVFVIPAVPYLHGLRLAPDALVQALGLSFTISTIALAIALADAGQFQLPTAGASLLALAASLGGMFLGQRVRAHLQPKTFRLCFLIGLLLLGAHLVVRSVL